MLPQNATDDTACLLERWHSGDETACHALIERHLERIRARVHHLLARFPGLRAENETLDLVNEAAVRALGYSPRFIPENGAQFEGLLVRLVRNYLVNRAKRLRCLGEVHGTEAFGLLDLRASSRSSDDPGRALEKAQERAWAAMAIEFLEEEDRELFLMRSVEGAEWEDVAQAFGIDGDAARMRFQRTRPKLANLVRMLREGQFPELAGLER